MLSLPDNLRQVAQKQIVVWPGGEVLV